MMNGPSPSSSIFINPRDEEKRLINEERQKLVLAKREFVLQALESYRRFINQGKTNVSIYEVKTRLQTLFDEIREEFQEDVTPEEFVDLCNNLEGNEPALVFDSWIIINKWLNKKSLMKIFKPEALL